jgi:hypothetical protein
MITTAEQELKLAMASGDPERLKKAIAAASTTVAKARARGTQLLKKTDVLHGDGNLAAVPAEHKQTVADAMTDEEQAYMRFHEIATDRKLALASRGFEVQNVFIDTLYDLALKEGVPQGEWGEFCRLQLPSPRLDDTDDVDAGAGGASVSYEVVSDGGAVKKVRKAMAKVTKLMGWRAKMASVARTYRQASSLIEKPEVMPAPDVGISDPTEAYGGGSLHGDVRSHATNAADAHLEMLRYDNGAPLTPSRDGETRA